MCCRITLRYMRACLLVYVCYGVRVRVRACLSISNAIELILLQFDSIFRLCFVFVCGIYLLFVFVFGIVFIFFRSFTHSHSHSHTLSLSLSPSLSLSLSPNFSQSILRFVYSLPSLCAEFVASSLSLLYPFRIYYLSSRYVCLLPSLSSSSSSPLSLLLLLRGSQRTAAELDLFAIRYCRKQCRLE